MGDKVKVNGMNIKGWERFILVNDDDDNKPRKKKQVIEHEYIKYWKPKGVICSTDTSIKNNIVDRIQMKDGYIPKRRIFPVGRLDRDASGLILLTSDERLAKAVLKKSIMNNQPKTYKVYLDRPISNHDIQILKVKKKKNTKPKFHFI